MWKECVRRTRGGWTVRKSVGRTARSALAIAALGLTLGCAGPAVAQSDEELAVAALDAVLKHILGGPYPIASRVRLEAYFVSRPGGGEPVLCGLGWVHGVYPVTFVSGGTPETTISWTGLDFLFSPRWVEQCLPEGGAGARNRSWLAIADQ
jgi:hypothetical protein